MPLEIDWRAQGDGTTHRQRTTTGLTLGSGTNNDVVLNSTQVAARHARIYRRDHGWYVRSDNDAPLLLNGREVLNAMLANGDTLCIGPFKLHIRINSSRQPRHSPRMRSITRFRRRRQRPAETTFPPASFSQQRVSLADLRGSGLPLDETTWLTVGGGLGSFAWVDYLRVCGVPADDIVVLGDTPSPYARFRRWCRNGQIGDDDRLRSDTGATPDNLWGWPGYAIREIARDSAALRLTRAARTAWQVISEPTLADTYTPRAGDVFRAIDREAARIGWARMWQAGHVRAIRQTSDGRYVVAYTRAQPNGVHQPCLMVACYLHVAVGYTGLNFSAELTDFRSRTGDHRHMVNAYEPHDHIYQQLRQRGGVVVLRGRGIVASRVLEQLHKQGQHNPHITVFHLLREPDPNVGKFEDSARLTENQFVLQPFNFPKAAFGGDLAERFAQANPAERSALLTDWGGVTTADRSDWRAIVQRGLDAGWYQRRFGRLTDVTPRDNGRLTVTVEGATPGVGERSTLTADYIIDATGLNAQVAQQPLLHDLMSHYGLTANASGTVPVDDGFELRELRNGDGRLFLAGVATTGAHYAPVDSFLGLQYAAQRAMLRLATDTGQVRPLTPLRSLGQWLRWTRGAAP